jgi:hypothetical protein
VEQFVEALRFKPQSHGFHSHWIIAIFHLLTPSGHIIVPNLTQPVTDMS